MAYVQSLDTGRSVGRARRQLICVATRFEQRCDTASSRPIAYASCVRAWFRGRGAICDLPDDRIHGQPIASSGQSEQLARDFNPRMFIGVASRWINGKWDAADQQPASRRRRE
jgi:hypothetical protein